MPRVMLLGKLPLAGQYTPPPGRLLQAGPGLYGVRRAGLGLTMEEVCTDPATMFMQAAAGAFSGAASSGCRTTSGGQQADAGWCAASTGTGTANTTLTAACQSARAAASQSGDPTEMETLEAQLEIERLRAQSTTNLAQMGAAARPAPDYKPYIIGGVALVAVVGLVYFLKKK